MNDERIAQDAHIDDMFVQEANEQKWADFLKSEELTSIEHDEMFMFSDEIEGEFSGDEIIC